MGSVGHVESFDREGPTTVVDPGGVALVTAEHYTPPGYDGSPLPGDFVALQPCSGTGKQQDLGCYDPKASNRKAGLGEGRVYGRKADGTAVCEVWCKADGSIVIATLEGTPQIEIRSKGTVVVNSPDVRLGGGGREVATVGDLVVGTLNALTTAPGAPIAPGPPDPVTGVQFVGQIVSGTAGVTASPGTGE